MTALNTAAEFTTVIAPRGDTLDEALASALGEAATASWLIAHRTYSPEVVTVSDGQGLAAALLITHRPYTAYRKIARMWARSDAALDTGVAALVTHAAEVGKVAALKWEDAEAEQLSHALRNGFRPMPLPTPSGLGTSQRAGYVRWLEDIPHRDVPYYRQTTEYSCGPVALLMAQSAETNEPITRAQELQLWRRSSHQPGAGPIALGVYTDLNTFRPEVFISTEEVILGEHLLKDWELEVRELFDGADELMAGELGIPITYRFLPLDELAAEIDSGAQALLLVDEIYFHDDTGSHWILAHGHAAGTFLINDPWIDGDNGDSWVDANDLPIAAADLNNIVMWGDPAFRALVVLRPTESTN